MTTHQPGVQLLHTELQVPHDRLRVTTLEQRRRPNGVAFTATLAFDGLNVGAIENNGNGEETWLRSPNNLFGWRRMAEYTAACSRHGEPVSEADVLNALVDEYDTDRMIREVTMCGRTLLRQRDSDGNVIDIVTTDRLFPRNSADARRAVAAHLLTHPGNPATGWEVWTGDRWTALDPIAPTSATTRSHSRREGTDHAVDQIR